MVDVIVLDWKFWHFPGILKTFKSKSSKNLYYITISDNFNGEECGSNADIQDFVANMGITFAVLGYIPDISIENKKYTIYNFFLQESLSALTMIKFTRCLLI